MTTHERYEDALKGVWSCARCVSATSTPNFALLAIAHAIEALACAVTLAGGDIEVSLTAASAKIAAAMPEGGAR